MFGIGSSYDGSAGSGSNANRSVDDYLEMAREAENEGESLLAAYLFMAAFEKDCESGSNPTEQTVEGLHKAMDLACAAHARAFAEHIFEKVGPYCSADQVKRYSQKMQELMFDKLEDFGLSRDDLQEMAGFFSGEAFGNAMLSHFGVGLSSSGEDGAGEPEAGERKGRQHSLLLPPSTPFGKIIEHRFTDDEVGKPAKKEKPAKPLPAGKKVNDSEDDAVQLAPSSVEITGFDELIGYDAAIQMMHERGIGLSNDERFKSFLAMLNRRHGIASLPSFTTLLFRSTAREDATHFMAATVGELGMPTVRMYMEEAPNGVPVLCIMASSDFRPQMQFLRNGADCPMVLMLEDVDMWATPLAGVSEGFDMPQANQVARGAREALMFIRSSVGNPYVTVVASCESSSWDDPFLHDILDPCEVIDVEVPNGEERAAIWKHVAQLYPSMRYVNLDDLVRYSASMSRYDIYMAAREAVEQAYGMSVRKRAYVPVTSDNILDKLAAYQPLDSDEYAQMEESVLQSFRRDLEHIDDLLDEDDI